jgi:hypothetical protein
MGPDVIRLEGTPPVMESLVNATSNPSEIDENCNELNVPAILANYNLATPIELSYLNIGLSKGVYIPKQITTREGGRKSLYNLSIGESVIAGIILSEDCMMLREVTRLAGTNDDFAENGDIYQERLLSRNGVLIYEGEGPLEITDEAKGQGNISLTQTTTDQYAQDVQMRVSVWIIWSCIKVEWD